MSSMLVLVTGATGNQGGAVARHLLAQGLKVRALTRDTNSPKAQALAKLGSQVVLGDLNDIDSLDAALRGVHNVFAVQDYWAKDVGFEGEVKQGKNLANAARKAGVEHFVQSGMAKAERFEGVEHFASSMQFVSTSSRWACPTQ